MTQNTDKPSAVSGAVGLLYVTMAMGGVRTVLEWTHITTIASSDFALITIVLTFVIQLWLIHKIDQGRNWSRILFALLFVIGIPFSIQPLLQSLSDSPLSGLLGLAQLGLQTIALFMLFSGGARCWFHPDEPASSSAAPLILLVLLLGGAAFFFLHDGSRPFAILPPQATTTPTPTPPESLPPPIAVLPPTPPPLPREVTLTTPIQMPVVIRGKPSGSVSLPRGTRLQLVSVGRGSVVVRYVDSIATIPTTATDFQFPTPNYK